MAVVQRYLLLFVLLLQAPSSASAGEHWEPTGEVILRFDDVKRPSNERLETLARQAGVRAVSPLAGTWPLYRVQLAPGSSPHTLASVLERQPDIRWAVPDRWLDLVPNGAPLNDPYWDQLWHLDNDGSLNGAMTGADIHAVPAWDLATGLGVIAAVLDGGVDPTQPDLLQEQGIDVLDDDTDASPNLDTESPAHGTAVAGLIAAIGDNEIGVAGVAWQATILPVRLIGGSSLADVYDAFAMVTDRGAAVINNSWGYRTEDCGDIQGSPVLDDALNYAHLNGRGGLGSSITFSMGNQSCHSQVQPLLSHPAAIGVGAVNKSSMLHGYSNTGIDVDVVAPSTGLRTTDIVGPAGMNGLTEDYTKDMGGTSGACPIVSGVIALMYEANPRLSADEVQVVLCATADRIQPEQADYDAVGWSSTYGCGRVDAAAAVAAVFNRPPSAPTWRLPALGETVFSDEVLLAWDPSTDLDDDPIRYSIELLPSLPSPGDDDDSAGDDDDSAAEDNEDTLLIDAVLETFWQADPEVLAPGVWQAQIWATDTWGRGTGSEVLEFEVTTRPPEPSDDGDGCSCQGGQQAGPLTALLLLLGLPAASQRRRFRPGQPKDAL